MFEFLSFVGLNVGLVFTFVEKLKNVAVVKNINPVITAGIVSLALPLGLYLSADQLIAFLSTVVDDPTLFPARPEDFPLGGYILTAIMNFFAAGGIYDFRKHTGGSQS